LLLGAAPCLPSYLLTNMPFKLSTDTQTQNLTEMFLSSTSIVIRIILVCLDTLVILGNSFNNLYNSLTRHLIQIQDSVGTKKNPKTKI
jgi:hypothetical protein